MNSIVRSTKRSAGLFQRMGVRAFSADAHTFDIPVEFKGHQIETPAQTAQATKDELMEYHRNMYTLRRMEIAADQEYKARNIRGFCHLYDGQEAVAQGVQAALNDDDDWITTYRCHGAAYMRGVSVQEIFEEMFGYSGGIAGGKGGSMHMYNKEKNFYGGAAIVGAQVPIGAGLGFFHKYKATKGCSITMYGDGSANQGQCWEAANMAALWKIPVIFACENNEYGMGTSVHRSSFITDYYKQGNTIPGLYIDGMDVLAVREGIKFVKEFITSGNGPMYVEFKTYRYHGHSMSDPGITYRTRDEVTEVRQSRDPIENVKRRLLEAGMATEDELKQIEKEVRGEVSTSLKAAKAGAEAPVEELFTDIYTNGQREPGAKNERLQSEYPEEIRMPDIQNTRFF
uniref:Pyruvate dehydrogenase E1 component subunit alpha n=2 Tax=Mucochytrium quahogii TaxID=96639 RepID=A0A7S2SIJ3_9STRA|mmetsp:Transcript_7336/g.11715  ORF Transcript_7336/g.11715 Transcript_7336/m.11715 type:complete len:399 (+) Transcript_7336:112-1308(+)